MSQSSYAVSIAMQAGREKSIPAPDGCFLMWHDYMDLRKTVSQLQEQRESRRAADGVMSPPEGFMKLDRSDAGSMRSIDSSSCGSVSSSNRDTRMPRDRCGFCKQNGETAEIYLSHRLKAKDGRILCPILRSYVCPYCAATGDCAHTRHYCPLRHRSMDTELQRHSRISA